MTKNPTNSENKANVKMVKIQATEVSGQVFLISVV